MLSAINNVKASSGNDVSSPIQESSSSRNMCGLNTYFMHMGYSAASSGQIWYR